MVLDASGSLWVKLISITSPSFKNSCSGPVSIVISHYYSKTSALILLSWILFLKSELKEAAVLLSAANNDAWRLWNHPVSVKDTVSRFHQHIPVSQKQSFKYSVISYITTCVSKQWGLWWSLRKLWGVLPSFTILCKSRKSLVLKGQRRDFSTPWNFWAETETRTLRTGCRTPGAEEISKASMNKRVKRFFFFWFCFLLLSLCLSGSKILLSLRVRLQCVYVVTVVFYNCAVHSLMTLKLQIPNSCGLRRAHRSPCAVQQNETSW